MVWLLRAGMSPDAAFEWMRADQGAADPGHGDAAAFAAARAAAPQLPVVLLLPAACALVTTVNAPLRQQRQLQQALPYLVEESLAGDIDLFQVVAGVRPAPDRLQVVAVERSLLAALLATLRAVDVDPPIVTVDALLLPAAPGGAGLFLDGNASLLLAADRAVLPFDEADLALVAGLPTLADTPLRAWLAEPASAVAARSLAVGDDEARPAVEIDEQALPLLARLASDGLAVRLRAAPNLRQGAFARQERSGFDPGFRWQPLAWLAAAFALVGLGYQLAVGISHGRAADVVRAEQEALYRQLFPQASSVVDPRRQMQGQLGSAAARDNRFIALVAETAAVLEALNAGEARFTPRSLSWEQSLGQLRLDMLARSPEDFEALRVQLEQRGLNVDIGAGVSQEGGYKARLNIGGGA